MHLVKMADMCIKICFILWAIGFAKAKTCYIDRDENAAFTCNLNSTKFSSLKWKVTRSNVTMTLFNCSISACQANAQAPVNELQYAAYIKEEATSLEISSFLNVSVSELKQEEYVSYENLLCEIDENITVVICDKIAINSQPPSMVCYPKSMNYSFMTVTCELTSFTSDIFDVNIVNSKYPSNVSVGSFIQHNCSYVDSIFLLNCDIFMQFPIKEAGLYAVNIIASNNASDVNRMKKINATVYVPVSEKLEPRCNQYVKEQEPYLQCVMPLSYGAIYCEFDIKSTQKEIYNFSTKVTISNVTLLTTNNSSLASTATYLIECTSSTNIRLPGMLQAPLIVTRNNTKGGTVTSLIIPWTSFIMLSNSTTINFTVDGMSNVVVEQGQNVTFLCSDNGISIAYTFINHIASFSNPRQALSWFTNSIQVTIFACENSGLYTCQGLYNGSLIIKNVYVSMPCQLRDTRDTLLENIRTKVPGVKRDCIALEVFGYPPPKSMVLTTIGSNDSIVSDGVSIKYVGKEGPYGTIWVNFTKNDFINDEKTFVLSVNNGVGNDTLFEFTMHNDMPNECSSLLWDKTMFLIVLFMVFSAMKD